MLQLKNMPRIIESNHETIDGYINFTFNTTVSEKTNEWVNMFKFFMETF